MSLLSFCFFGPPRIEIDGVPIEINRRKAVALLAYLAVTGQAHSRETLAALLWPEVDQTRARAALRSALWTLNKTALQEWLVIEPERVALCPTAPSVDAGPVAEHTSTVDTACFEALVDAAQSKNHDERGVSDERLDALTRAAALYQNDFLAGFTLPDTPNFDDWQYFQANDLREKLAWALETLAELHRTDGDFALAIADARRYVAIDPLHEPAHRLLMQLYAESGQQSAALRQYEICRDRLDAELGVPPSAETDALFERIRIGEWRVNAPKEEPVTPAVSVSVPDSQSSVVTSPNNLPAEPTPLIGREHELSRLVDFLGDKTTRLLTVVGPGGIGKTRLALAAAAGQVEAQGFADGVYFVALVSLSDEESIVPTIAQAVGFPFQDDSRPLRQQLLDFLSNKSLLLLLDNLEHLLSGQATDAGAFVDELLQQAPRVKVLTTSRERLNLYEEQRYPLKGLAVPETAPDETGPTYAAARLFLQSVRRRMPDYEFAAGDAPHLAELSRLVEGVPLALELAASEMESLSLREIIDGIRENLDLLATDLRNVPVRHRSMQAVFDSSWQTLNEIEQQFYAQLSIFRGGFAGEAVEALTMLSEPRAQQILQDLVHKSLLSYDRVHKRYEIHELLRQYAAGKLADDEELARNRHANFYCTFLQQREAALKGPRQQDAIAEIESDSDNALAAWRWAVDHVMIAELAHALTPLSFFYQWRGRLHDGQTLCQLASEKLSKILAARQAESTDAGWTPSITELARVLAQVLTWEGLFDFALNQYENARRTLQQAQELFEAPALAEEKTSTAYTFLLLQLSNLAGVDDFGGDSMALGQQALAVYDAAGDEWGRAQALDNLSQNLMSLGDHEEALRLREECLAILQCLGDERGIARSYNLLGLIALHVSQLERSESYLRKSLSIYGPMDNPAAMAVLGINLLFAGRFAECIATFDECWSIHHKLGLVREPFTANVSMTRARINLGHYDKARVQAEEGLATYRTINSPWHIAFALYNLGRIDLIEGAVEKAHQQLLESSEILQQMNEKSLLPDVLFCLAYSYRALEQRQRVAKILVQALQLVIETGPLNPMRFELPLMALLKADQGDVEQAIEYYAAALQSSYIRNSIWFEEIAGQQIEHLAATLTQEVVTAAQARGQARDLWQTANDLLATLNDIESDV